MVIAPVSAGEPQLQAFHCTAHEAYEAKRKNMERSPRAQHPTGDRALDGFVELDNVESDYE